MGTRMTRADRQDQLIKSFVRPRYRISRAMGAAKIQVNGQPKNVDVYFYISFIKLFQEVILKVDCIKAQ